MIAIAPTFTQKEYRWTAWKAVRAAKGMVHQSDDDAERYMVYGYDGPEVHLCYIYKGTVPDAVVGAGYTQEQNDADKADFEGNYYLTANKPIVLTDADGSPLGRAKTTQSGWQYRVHGIEFKTCKPGSVFEEDDLGVAFNFTSLKFYNISDEELTEEAAIQNAETGAVRTVMDWEPTHDIELLGGKGKQLVQPGQPVRVWVRAVPHVPSNLGGNKLFLSCINLQYLSPYTSVESDGRSPKLLKYNATYHTNLLRFTIKHPPGFQHDLAFWMEFFRA